MSERIKWDQIEERLYETGVDRGVVYPQVSGAYPNGEGWNGLTGVTLSPSGAEATPLYANNHKYLNLMSVEELGGTIEAYTYPDSFAECDGSAALATGVKINQQKRKSFGFTFRVMLGNDTEGTSYGYKIYLVYGCLASPSEQANATINDSPEAKTMSWEFSTTPVDVSGFEPTASIEIDSTKFEDGEGAAKLKQLEDILYGVDAETFSVSKTYAVGDYCTYTESEGTEKLYKCKTAVSSPGQWDSSKWDEIGVPGPRLPLPEEVATIFGDQIAG